jgi:hypothetical protein
LMSVQLLDFWEFSQNPEARSLRQCISRGDAALQGKVADYLDRARMLSVTTMPVYDVLSDEKTQIGRHGTRTDGVWIWRADLSFYVRTYNILLPSEFTDRAAGFDWIPPAVTDERIDAIVEEITEEDEE